MKACVLLVVSCAATGARAHAQEEPAPADGPSSVPSDPSSVEEEFRRWSFDVSAFTVNPPEDEDAYASTVLRADRDQFHLEGRWNYEDRHTASLWAGWNLDWTFGEEQRPCELAITPMAGLVFGDTDGWAPGLELDASWWIFELYNESEYLFDWHDDDDDFFYSWTELAAAPVEWLRFGLVAQRTHAFETDRSLDRGLLLGLSFRKVSGTVYWFNPGDSGDDYVTFSLGFSF